MAVQIERHVPGAARREPVGVLQRAAGLSAGDLGSDAEPAERRQPDRHPAEPCRPDAAAQLSEPRSEVRASAAVRRDPVVARADRVQRVQLEHGAGHPKPAECLERQLDPGAPGSTGRPVRRSGELLMGAGCR